MTGREMSERLTGDAMTERAVLAMALKPTIAPDSEEKTA